VAANNRKFQEFMDRFAADTVSTKVRSLMWECWVAATEAAEVGEPTHNRRITKCPKCGSSRICYWMAHDKYGCYNCDWIEGTSYAPKC